MLKKEFIGPGLHPRPVCADRVWPPLQWALHSVLSACGNDNGKIRPALGRGILKKRKQTLITPALDSVYRNVTTGLSVINWLECNRGLIDY